MTRRRVSEATILLSRAFTFVYSGYKVIIANPCTLVPTDFRLHRKMKLKFYFRFSFFFVVKKRNWTSNFVFHFSPLGKKRNFENGLRFVFGFLFSVYGIETDNLFV